MLSYFKNTFLLVSIFLFCSSCTDSATEQNRNETLDTKSHIAEVIAKNESWLKSIADGVHKQEILKSGDKVQFLFTDTLTLTVGNPGGIDINYDAHPHHIGDGTHSTVRTFIFPPEP